MPSLSRAVREAILAAHDYICFYCKDWANEADHIISRKLGGTNDLENLVASCRSCNSKKRSRRLSRINEIAAFKAASDCLPSAAVFLQRKRTYKKSSVAETQRLCIMHTEFSAQLRYAQISQADFARLCGVSTTAVSYWCRGRRDVPQWAWALSNAARLMPMRELMILTQSTTT